MTRLDDLTARAKLRGALLLVEEEAIRDPTPHSSAWLIPAGAMDVVRAVLRNVTD